MVRAYENARSVRAERTLADAGFEKSDEMDLGEAAGRSLDERDAQDLSTPVRDAG